MDTKYQPIARLLMLALLVSDVILMILLHNLGGNVGSFIAPIIPYRQRPVVLYRGNITKIKKQEDNALRDIYNVLNFDLQSKEEKPSSYDSNWDILWSNTFPFAEDRDLVNYCNNQIIPGQKINHFPKIPYIAQKAYFNLKGGNKYTPKTFLYPDEKEEFQQEIAKPDSEERVWIRKNKNHRGNSVISDVKDIPLKENESFLIQEFITNQFLLDDRVINNGIFVLITSVYPLRAYILDSIQVVRLCNKAFYPIDYNDIETYVTDGEHSNMDILGFSPMKKYFDTAYSRKQALEAYIMSTSGKDTVETRNQIYDAIQDTLVTLQHKSLGNVKDSKFKSERSHFFEILRYDFLLDNDLNVHLIEANMSPELHNTVDPDEMEQFINREENKHVVYSALSTMGYLHARDDDDHWIRNSDININREVCYTDVCTSCQEQECNLCSNCMSQELISMLKVSYAEHINRQGFRKVYPQRMTQKEAQLFDIESYEDLVPIDQINKAWLRAKCLQDVSWCT